MINTPYYSSRNLIIEHKLMIHQAVFPKVR